MPEEPPEGDNTFTPPASQEEFDKMVGARLARERQRFADYDELKAKAAKLDEAEQASKTELQRLQDAINERDGKLAELPREVRKQALRFASIASQRGFLDPEDALVFLDDVDLGDKEAVEVALDDLAERKPHLVKAQPKTRVPSRPKPEGGTPESGDEGLKGKERAAAALRQFRSVR